MRRSLLNKRILPKPLRQALVLITLLLLPSAAWGGTITKTYYPKTATSSNLIGESEDGSTCTWSITNGGTSNFIHEKGYVSQGVTSSLTLASEAIFGIVKNVTVKTGAAEQNSTSSSTVKINVTGDNNQKDVTVTDYSTFSFDYTKITTEDKSFTMADDSYSNVTIKVDVEGQVEILIESITVEYVETYGLKIGETALTSDNVDSEGNITGFSGITFIPASGDTHATLFLNNASISSGIISSLEALTINLEGTNTLSGSIYYSGSATDKTLAFTGDGSLGISGNGLYGAIYSFTGVDFGDFNLATPSAGTYYVINPDYADLNGALGTMQFSDFTPTNNVTITKDIVYPLWIGTSPNSFTQVTQNNKNDILGNGKITFDGNNDLTLKGASLAGNIISGLSRALNIVVDGANEIAFDDDSTTCIRNFAPNATLSIQKSNDSENCSLLLNGPVLIKNFSSISYKNGIYLSSAKDGQNNDLNPNFIYYNYSEGFKYTDNSNIKSITFSTTKPSESIWIGNTEVGADGTFTDIVDVSFDKKTNTLTLNDANISANIISSLPYLTINLTSKEENGYGQSNLGEYYIISSNPSATLTFTTDGKGFLSSTAGNSDIPWKGFADIPTFKNKLVFFKNGDTEYIRVLSAPTMSYSDSKLTLSGLSYENEQFSYYYAITYADNKGNISKTKKTLTREEPYPATDSEYIDITHTPFTVEASVEFEDQFDNITESETTIGKYFGIADKTIDFNNKTKGTELKIDELEISPATENVNVTGILSVEASSDVISLDNDNKATIVGIGNCTVTVNFSVDNDANFQVLNSADGEVFTTTGLVTVLPDKPTIVKEEKDYLNTDKITITRTSVEGEVADDIKIFYTWNAEEEVGSEYIHDTDSPTLSIYDSTKPIPAQTGTLRAWVGYHLGDSEYLLSEPDSQKFTVKTDISDYTLQGLEASTTYTGAAIVPAFSVKASADAETSLTLNTDYTVSYQSVIIAAGDVGSGPSINYTDVDEMVEVGAYRIVITGTGDNYGGTTYADFAIDKADLDIVTIEAIADQTYTGSEITPEITVKLNGNTLSASDYGFSIGYSNNINVATSTSAKAPTVTITATEGSNYFTAGTTKVANFNIVQKSLTDESISVTLSASSFTYNGDIQYPEITVKDGETTLTSEAYGYSYSQDGTAVDGPATAGTYTLTIYGKGNYTGEITKEITITPKEIATADITVTLATTSYTFDGTEHKPEVSSVTISDVTDPIEYEDAVYTNNVNAALATATENAPTVTVSLKGNYSGTGVATFTIEQADLSDYVVTGLTTPTAYTGSPITPTFSVKATETAETSLTANTDYSVKYQQAGADVDEMKDAGDYKILITGEGNYKGSLDADFTIERAQLNLTINLEGWAYGDTPNEPSLEGNLGEGDITWEYKAAGAEAYSAWSTLTTTTDAGTYMVKATVAETDNYEGGSKEAEFVIEQLDISQADITLDNNELTYNGEQQTVNVTKVMAGNIEVPIDCYEVSGNTKKEAGDYKLTVTAKTMDSSGNPIKNNFTGSAEKGWKIKNRTVTTDELGLSENQSQATYYSETEDLEVPEGVVAYIITGVNGNNVVTQRIRYIKKGVAVFVEQTTSTENPLEVIPDASELPLKGTAVDLNVASISGGTVYVLYKGEFVKSTTGTIPAKRCYLLLPNNVAAGTRAFGIIGGGSDGSTAIKSINDEPSTIDNWYDMGGHRIEKPTKTGIYIKNGKKVAIK